MKAFAFLSVLLVAHGALAKDEKGRELNDVSPGSVIREMNLARQDPARYATFIEVLRARMTGNVVVVPGGTKIRMKEGAAALDEAIRFLRSAPPQGPLAMSPGMCRAAADHCGDQAGGEFGHRGRDASNAFKRISRYGTCGGGWAENISYGKTTARAVVLALIIDDGQPARKHRKNIFNSSYNFAGAAFGRHARFGTMCSIDFAVGYTEQTQSAADALLARNL